MSSLTIAPDYDSEGEPFRHTWQGMVNVDHFRWLLRRDVQDQLHMAHEELGARFVRAPGIFDDDIRVLGLDPATFRDEEGQAFRENWQLVDAALDAIRGIGLEPVFHSSFFPGALVDDGVPYPAAHRRIVPPEDLTTWANMIGQAVRHMIWRYGEETVRGWTFEVWDKPNLPRFWAGTPERFFAFWKATYHAIKDEDDQLQVAGPSTARAAWLREFIAFASTNDCMPGEFTAEVHDNEGEFPPEVMDGIEATPAARQSEAFAEEVIRSTRRELDEMGFRGRLHWNAWGRSWFPIDPHRETPSEAAFIVKTMAAVSQCADRFTASNLSDICDRFGYGCETFQGLSGLLNLQGLRKPAWHAFELLNRLGDQRLPCKLTGASPNVGAIATRSSTGVAILAWADAPDGKEGTLTVELTMPPGTGRGRLTRVSAVENNILLPWRQMGSPEHLLPDELDALRNANHLLPSSLDGLRENVEAGTVAFDLPTPGIALVDVRTVRPSART